MDVYMSHSARVAIGQLQVSSHNLEIEARRATHIPREHKICRICRAEVASEEYYVCSCRAYHDTRSHYSTLFSGQPTLRELMESRDQRQLVGRFQVLFTCILLVCLFSLQQYGTHRVAFLFAPIVILWLLTISSIGIYNILKWNPTVIKALSPYYMYKYVRLTGIQGWLSFGGIVLCLTGTEAMFANLGHFSPMSIKVSFAGGVYPCIVLSYMGQGAFLAKNQGHILQSFYKSVPDSIYWPVVVVATLASVVASQSVISATFSIINQCKALGCFPHVKVIHMSTEIPGQIDIPEINWMLMLLSLSVTLGFRDTSLIGNAYVVIIVWRKHLLFAVLWLLIFGTVEIVYFSASLIKVPKGGWVPLALALLFMAIMCIWHYGTTKKREFEIQNKVSMKQILSLGPSLDVQDDSRLFEEMLVESIEHFVRLENMWNDIEKHRASSCTDEQNVDTEKYTLNIDEHETACNFGVHANLDHLVNTHDTEINVVNSDSSMSGNVDGIRNYSNSSSRLCGGDIYNEHSIGEEELKEAKVAGVTYVLGRSIVRASKNSSLLKRAVINHAYSFLKLNCRSPALALHVPHPSLIRVGMVCHV
ncbi:hypothetical protein L7F22_069302 [Adiantum nelumboides]|nr:hypothetical protein [Adiantum nelumboides]